MEALSLAAKILLDAALNLRQVYSPDELLESVEILTGRPRSELIEVWQALVREGILVQKDYTWLISQSHLEKIKETIQEDLSKDGISADRVTDKIESKIQANPEKIHERLSLFVRLLGSVYISEPARNKAIMFSDGEWHSDLGYLCEELVKERLAFRYSGYSRKHSYRTFYLRVWPFDVEDIIRNIVLKHLNIKGLTDNEWRVICLLLLSDDLSLEYETIKNNLTFTDPQLREIITTLEERGLITERYGTITLPRALRDPLLQYFKTTAYQKFKSNLISQLKKSIEESIAVLWLFATAKVIYDLPGQIKTEPILLKTINKTSLKEFENQLGNIKSLGILYDLGNDVVILGDVIRDVENWLKNSIKQSVIVIPARDYYLARSVFQDIFLHGCQEYVKIQDPYLGEETFDLLEYVPTELQMRLLTGIRLGEGEDPTRIRQRIERLQAQRRGKFQILFLGDRITGEAPFHDRFIISKTRGWQVGTSLKQVGKGKDTTLSEISKIEKEEMIEPAFDRWWNMKASELEQRNLVKMNFEEWKGHLASRTET